LVCWPPMLRMQAHKPWSFQMSQCCLPLMQC
jgi:hypothetical protein